ncbi:trypsin-like serine peptidase [Tritonibacter litoralis]|nr:trypsin-like serine protease [Tritonibacter litoralis]
MAETSGLRRLTQRGDLLGWEAVGRLDLSGLGYCTATLIETDLVLTAAHCVYGKDGKLLPADKITFRAGLSDGVALAERQALQVEAHPKYLANGKRSWDRVRHDVALIRLRDPISTTIADPFILHSGKDFGDDISITSYGRGRSGAPSRQKHCAIVDRYRDLYDFDCSTAPGSSGSPVFSKVGGRGRIVSIISGHRISNGRRIPYGMALPERVAELKAQMRRNRVTAPVGPATAVRQTGGARSSAKFVRPGG